jgi:hypothetical protein
LFGSIKKNVTNNYIAHIKSNSTDTFDVQDLVPHLEGVGNLASKFSEEFSNAEWGKIMGLWHDIG